VCNWHARGRVNVIKALIGKCLLTVGLFKSNINADTFFGWMVHDLLPELPPASVVVMDNATFHKRQDIQNIAKPARNDSKSILIVSSSTNGHTPKHCVNNKTKPLRCSSNFIYSESFLTGYAI
jgi:hypothetical protein